MCEGQDEQDESARHEPSMKPPVCNDEGSGTTATAHPHFSPSNSFSFFLLAGLNEACQNLPETVWVAQALQYDVNGCRNTIMRTGGMVGCALEREWTLACPQATLDSRHSTGDTLEMWTGLVRLSTDDEPFSTTATHQHELSFCVSAVHHHLFWGSCVSSLRILREHDQHPSS